MMNKPYVTVREAAQILKVSEGKLMELIDGKKLQAYRIAGQYLRLKRADVLQVKASGDVASETVKFPYTARERLRDFLYYNDVYIAALMVILGLLYIIFFTRY
ncbi:MAG: helix-turn-helix domain-containing protein [Candidatus Omnitrophota bacterium]